MVVDDSTLDKLYAEKMELVNCYERSGKHHRLMKGINLTTLLWTEGTNTSQLTTACTRSPKMAQPRMTISVPCCKLLKSEDLARSALLFDSWFGSLDNLKTIRSYGWLWLTRLKRNRQVNPDNTGNRPVCEVNLSEDGTMVHLKGYGLIKVFKIVAKDLTIEYWATNDLKMPLLQRLQFAEFGSRIEEYHRGLPAVLWRRAGASTVVPCPT